jgi:ParB family chromosome partitioning protein
MDLLTSLARGTSAPAPVAPAEEAPVVEAAPALPVSAVPTTDNHGTSVQYIEIGSITANPYQPRQIFAEEELTDLANSITEHGILQPILVRPLPSSLVTDGVAFQLIAGERRWRAAQRAGLDLVPAIVRSVGDQEALELALIENVQRHDISAIESAQAYKRLADEFKLSQEEIAKRVGKSRAAVANTIRLLDLPEEAITALRDGKITEGHGRALLMASGDSGRRALLRRVIRDGLSVREVERLARDVAVDGSEPLPPLNLPSSPDMDRLEKTLQRALGTKLKLKPRKRGGQIIIDFYSPEDLHRLVKRMTAGEK